MERLDTATDEAFVTEAVRWLTEKITVAIAAHDSCRLGLSGGATPAAVYTALGQVASIDWSKVHVFLLDERYVPADNAESNQKLLHDTLLQHAKIPTKNLRFPDTTLSIGDCVKAYAVSLVDLFQQFPPDVVTLGLGTDGHIASLFPPLEEAAFGEVLALHTVTDQFAVPDRISVSPLVILAAQAHLLLLKGEEKIRVFEDCIATETDPVRWPLHIALATERVTVVCQQP